MTGRAAAALTTFVLTLAACGSSTPSASRHGAAPAATTTTFLGTRIDVQRVVFTLDEHATPRTANERAAIAGLGPANAAALLALARERGLPPPKIVGDGANLGHDIVNAGTVVPLAAPVQRVLHQQLALARAAARRLQTPAEAIRAGYVLAAPFAPGDGVHYVKWSEVVKPFDPATPSMLLFSDVTPHAHLIAFSYYTRSLIGAPQGFAGPNDHWHQHFGLCIFHGASASENTQSLCDGAFLNGSDLYMLHVWLAEPNKWGLFAPINPVECHGIPGCGGIPIPPKS